MDKFIPLSVPNLKGNEKKYVLQAIDEEWVSTGGKYITKFEEDISNYINVKGAVACQSGTAGLHLALILSGVSKGDEVIVPTLTFIAAVNPVRYLGADPIFMDCDEGLTIDARKIEEFCEKRCEYVNNNLINRETGKNIKAIVVVHVFGNIAKMDKINEIARKYNLKVIEGATEALGSKMVNGRYKNRFAGTMGDFGVFSFNGNKIITTGGGGMLIAKEDELLKKAKYLSTQAKDDSLYYVHNEIGYNYRMTNLQAALGIAQLEQLDTFIKIKKSNYEIYKKEIENINGLLLMNFSSEIQSNYWLYSLLIDERKYLVNRDELIDIMAKNNIQTRPIWGLIHEQKPYKNCETYKISKASDYIRKIINIPSSSNLEKSDIERVVKVLQNL